MKNACAVITEGASDTTPCLAEAFCLAMALHPQVQERAHAELDKVMGPDRLADHSDSDALVYVSAMVRETLRWHPVSPLAFGHRTVEDAELSGYFIPAGTTVVPNVWCAYTATCLMTCSLSLGDDTHRTYKEMLHAPETYDCPSEFRPERFIKDGKLDLTVRDPVAFIFGFGRRRVLLGPSATFPLSCLS
ncbi:cytochrome P450 [Trametes elegans]|nr:cytochrome P450 [Trametes elegans]